jgi:hypothetical protein
MELDQAYVWITIRTLQPGSYDEFTQAWKPREIPQGMLQAWECYDPDRNEVVGISTWESPEARDAFRLSEVENERRRAMAPYVLEERSGFYRGRELRVPAKS